MAKNASRNRPRDIRKREAVVPYMAALANSVPAEAQTLTCACGGRYRDHPESKSAHQAVFGHRPIPGTPGGDGWTG